MRWLLVLLLVSLPLSLAASHNTCRGRAWYAEQVAEILRTSALGAHIAIDVLAPPSDAAGGYSTWFRENGEKMMTPASNTKLLTIGTSFLQLDHNATATTELIWSSNNDSSSSLCVACGGDPSFTEADMADLAQQLSQKKVSFSSLAVQPRYPSPEFTQSWMWEDITADYGAHPAQGCLVNEGAYTVTINASTPLGQPPIVTFSSPAVAEAIDFRNLAVTVSVGAALSVGYQMGAGPLIISGGVQQFTSQTYTFAAPNSNDFFARMFQYYLRQYNVLSSDSSFTLEGVCPSSSSSSTFSLVHSSAPFWQLWNFTFQNSDNLYAETFARTLGYPNGGPQGGTSALDLGLTVITQTLQANDIGGNWQLWDGSGVSCKNLIQPQTLTDLLLLMHGRSDFDLWLHLLPVGCESGTLSTRFCTPPTKGNVFAKTGTVTGVSALSGYAFTPYSSQPFIFSTFVNNAYYGGTAQRQIIDAVVSLLFSVEHC